MSVRPGVAALATACGLLVGLVVAVLTDPGVALCVDTTGGTSYCRAQGGPDLLAALGAGVVTAACVAVLLRHR